jgi:ribosomal protein L37AE/L43A
MRETRFRDRRADETVPTPESPQRVFAPAGHEEAKGRQPAKEVAMRAPSGKASRPHHMICPFCESGELISLGHDFARCGSCGMPLLGSTLETLRDITGLPDALGAHPCECGHPEMRELPGGVFHCPACRSEVLALEARSSLPGSPAGSIEGYTDSPEGGAGGTVRKRS